MTGKVLAYHRAEGYAFIRPDQGGKDIFVHVKDVRFGKLLDGAYVDYDVDTDKNSKPRAVNVRVLATTV